MQQQSNRPKRLLIHLQRHQARGKAKSFHLKTSLWDFLRRKLNKYKDKMNHIDHCSQVVINFIPLRMVHVNSNPVKRTCGISLQTTPEGSRTLNWYLLMKVCALKEKGHEYKQNLSTRIFPFL